MKNEKLLDAIGSIDDNLVHNAVHDNFKKKKPVWVKWGAIAACLCLIVVAIIAVPSMLPPQESDGGGGGTIVDGDQNTLQDTPTLFAKQSVVDAIKQDITNQDIESWTETTRAVFDLEYVIPIYSTTNATKDSLTILETLAFDNQYMIPVMYNGKCIGTATVAQQENKWVIAIYEHGFDLKAEVDKNKDAATCFVDVVQLNERGFLISTDTEEFVAVSGFGISDNMSGQELLNRILNIAGSKNNTEG